jgi:hypothetical protein
MALITAVSPSHHNARYLTMHKTWCLLVRPYAIKVHIDATRKKAGAYSWVRQWRLTSMQPLRRLLVGTHMYAAAVAASTVSPFIPASVVTASAVAVIAGFRPWRQS